jgi:hypothetical protein
MVKTVSNFQKIWYNDNYFDDKNCELGRVENVI